MMKSNKSALLYQQAHTAPHGRVNASADAPADVSVTTFCTVYQLAPAIMQGIKYALSVSSIF